MKTINFNKHIALVTVAALSAAGFAAGAQAGETPFGADSRTVHYADLNLNDAAGAKILYQRIRGAAVRVCGDVDAKELSRAAQAKACVDRAILESVRAVNRAELTRMASAHGYEVATAFNVASSH